jgi:antitoxin (DNA-binding transcriptional repressor) of toxin-antitoxin stability system
MATTTIDVNELPGRIAEAVAWAEHGDEVIVTVDGHPAARLTPVPGAKPQRTVVLGLHPGSAEMAPDFNASLPDDFWLSGNP